MTDNKSLIEEIYEGMRKLPYKSDELELLNSKVTPRKSGNFFYNLFTTTKKYFNGIPGRVKLWRERILPYFFNLPAVKMAQEGGLEMKAKNDFFGSRITIRDKETKSSLRIKAPWFSSILSYLFGNLTKSRLYVPSDFSDVSYKIIN
ncbi:Uncharacterised protein [uncultured archaeon]|nr:Uncharacterised protein [uncultured archaeon]